MFARKRIAIPEFGAEERNLVDSGASHPAWADRIRRLVQLAPWGMLAVLVAQRILRSLYLDIVTLDERSYFAPVIFFEALKQPLCLAMLIGPLAIGIWKRRELAWHRFENGQAVKYFVTATAAILAYAYSSYAYNAYLDRMHGLDRCLLVLLAGLILVHPLFTGAFVWLVTLMAGQFDHPIGHHTWTPQITVYSILVLFIVFVHFDIWRKRGLREFVFLAICLQASNYFYCGVRKITLGWLFRNDVTLLGVQSYVNGWLSGIEPRAFLNAVERLRFLNVPILVLTMVIELAVLFSFFHRRIAIWGLVGCVLLHAGIFAASGICFWKWALLDIALIVLILRTLPAWEAFLFRRRRTAWLGMGVILIAPLFFKPVNLGWYDSPLNNSFELEVVGESGTVYPVGRQFFAPYDCTVSQNRFWYLLPRKYLVGTYGATANYALLRQLEAADSADDIAAIEERFGQIGYDANEAEAFDRFITSFFATLNQRRRKTPLPIPLTAPPHVWSTSPPGGYSFQEPARDVRVRYLVTWYRDGAIQVLHDDVIRVIHVERTAAESASPTTRLR